MLSAVQIERALPRVNEDGIYNVAYASNMRARTIPAQTLCSWGDEMVQRGTLLSATAELVRTS